MRDTVYVSVRSLASARDLFYTEAADFALLNTFWEGVYLWAWPVWLILHNSKAQTVLLSSAILFSVTVFRTILNTFSKLTLLCGMHSKAFMSLVSSLNLKSLPISPQNLLILSYWGSCLLSVTWWSLNSSNPLTLTLDFWKKTQWTEEAYDEGDFIICLFFTPGENTKATEASYKVSFKAGKPHSIGEKLVKPAAKVMAKKASDKTNRFPLSNDTVQRSVLKSVAESVEDRLVTRLHQIQFFSLQLDESTNMGSEANLLVRYIYAGGVHDDFLYCRSLLTNTTGESIFHSLNDSIVKNNMDWSAFAPMVQLQWLENRKD